MNAAEVYVGKERYSVDGELYADFLSECVAGDQLLVDYLLALEPGHRVRLSRYICHRLAEVDPGWLP